MLQQLKYYCNFLGSRFVFVLSPLAMYENKDDLEQNLVQPRNALPQEFGSFKESHQTTKISLGKYFIPPIHLDVTFFHHDFLNLKRFYSIQHTSF